MTRTTLIIGGTGAQGSAVARILARSGKFTVKILTRSVSSPEAQDLASISNISIIEGDSYCEPDLVAALKGVDSIYVNTNGFAIGEKAETYWGVRIYELARREGVKHYVYAGLDYLGPATGYQDKYHVGHYEGKGRVGEFLKSQPTTPIHWTNLLSGPYLENLVEILKPRVDATGTYIFAAPLHDGALPLIHLDDMGRYVLWALENPSKSSGLELGIATEHVSWIHLASTFTKVTGKPSKFYDIPLSAWLDAAFPQGWDKKLGGQYAPGDETLMSVGQNFSAWWTVYRESGENKGIIKRDYELLDKILPGRLRSLEEWMRLTGYDGTEGKVLKSMASNMAT